MTLPQTSVTSRLRPAVAGMIANARPKDIVSKVLQDASIGFGKAVMRGTADNQVKAFAMGTRTAAGSMDAGNTGANTITSAPAATAGVKEGRWTLNAVTAGAAAVWELEDPDGVIQGRATTAVAATIAGIGPFTIADPGTDAAVGDRAYIDVTTAGYTDFIGITVRDVTLARALADAAYVDLFKQGETMSCVREGVIWVAAAVAVTAGQDVYVTPTTTFTNTSNSGANRQIPRAKWDSSTTGADVARVELR